MKKLLIGLLALGSFSSFAFTEVQLSQNSTLIAQETIEIEDGAIQYSGISIERKDFRSDPARIFVLDVKSNKARKICKAFGHKRAIKSSTTSMRTRSSTLFTGMKVNAYSCQLKKSNVDIFNLMEGAGPVFYKSFCNDTSNDNKGLNRDVDDQAFDSVTCK